jgi:hypothetical protein
MDDSKEKTKKLSATKDALYTTIAAASFAALALGAILFARSMVKRDPTTQSYHLIGFTMIWFVAMGFFFIVFISAWFKYFTVPHEERKGWSLFLRGATLYLLIITTGFLTVEASLIIYSILFR